MEKVYYEIIQNLPESERERFQEAMDPEDGELVMLFYLRGRVDYHFCEGDRKVGLAIRKLIYKISGIEDGIGGGAFLLERR